MSPYREACAQLENDQRYQAFMDWARKASVPTLLWQVEQLMQGRRDPFYGLAVDLLAMGERDGWSKVIELIAQVQREKEQAA